MSDTEPTVGQTTDTELTAAAANQLGPLSELVEATFTEMSRSIEDELVRLSSDSRTVVRDMVDGILEDLTRLAAERLISSAVGRSLANGTQEGVEAGGDVLGDLIRQELRNG
ncbi:MAG: phage tail tape measure C-terminal domain-containing protein [Pseudomonadota bacterium]